MSHKSPFFEKLLFEEIKDELIVKAIENCTLNHAYSHSPYSNFRVVASMIFQDGEVMVAANQENIAFPSGICAEANLISSAGSRFPDQKPKVIVVRAFKANGEEVDFISPCGNCRQIFVEYENRFNSNVMMLFGSKNAGFYKVNSARDLLPMFFSPDSLE